MSYKRVQVAESSLSWSETMKVYRKSVEPALKAFKKTESFVGLVIGSNRRPHRTINHRVRNQGEDE